MSSEPFENEEKNQEVRDMIALGLLDSSWSAGLDRQEAEDKFNQFLSTGQSSQNNVTEPFEDEEKNQEVRNMIALGLLDSNWAAGLDRQETEDKFNQFLCTGQSSQNNVIEPFEDEEKNQEVRNMIALGLLDSNWAAGLDRQETEDKFNHVLSTGQCSSNNEAEGLSEKGAKIKLANNLSLVSGGNPKLTVTQRNNQFKKQNYNLIYLNPDDPDFQDILRDFKNSKCEMKIESIQKIENVNQKKFFKDEIEMLKTQHGKEFNLNIRDLYHSSTGRTDLICSYGLDQRLGLKGCFGRGIYLSDNLKKCEQYLSKNKDNYIYKCRVILGDIKKYPKGKGDPELTTEPEKEDGDRYHSVMGNISGHDEYVVYDNRRCLIKYRIVPLGNKKEEDDVKEKNRNIDEEFVKKEDEENKFKAFKRHIQYMVDTCKHDHEEDEETEEEIRNIEKIRIEIRWRREITAGETPTKVTYDLLRRERNHWKKIVKNSAGTSEQPPPQNLVVKTKPNEDMSPELESVFDDILSSFVAITGCSDLDFAGSLIMNSNYILDEAVCHYFELMD